MVFSCFGSIAKRLPLCVCGYVLGLFSFPLGVPKVPLRTPANDHFLPRLSSDVGGVLLFRIHCQEAAVLLLTKARLRHVFCLGCVTFFCLRTGALFFSFRGSKGATSHPCEWPFFASPELGFRWCFAVSHPLPRGCRFAFVQARLRHVFCLRTGLFSSPLGAPKVPLRIPANDHFLPRLSSDLGCVLLFRIHCQ